MRIWGLIRVLLRAAIYKHEKIIPYHIVDVLFAIGSLLVVEVVDFGVPIDDECTRGGQLVTVHVRWGTLATGTGRRGWGVRSRRCCDFRTGHDGTEGHYVRDLAGGVQEVRRGGGGCGICRCNLPTLLLFLSRSRFTRENGLSFLFFFFKFS